jgi:chorismate dehydratase
MMQTLPEGGKATDTLRVGRIPFLVCAPYFHGSLLGLPGVEFLDGPPRDLNKRLAAGQIDCAPSSSFEYAKNAEDYVLIPGLCTSGRGEVKSVLLFSQVPWEQLEAHTIALSPESDTSNALVRVLSRFRFGVNPVFLNPEDGERGGGGDGPSGMVAIGDTALREAALGAWPYRYDLARVWQEWQGTPLPVGVWIVRAAAAREHSARLEAYVRHLEESLKDFFAQPNQRLDAWEAYYRLPLQRADALDFFSTADYRLTPAHEKALEAFFGFCAQLGLIDQVPRLKWFEAQR